MANDYSTVANVKALMPDPTWTTSYDVLFTSLITRASRMIDAYHKREPGSYAVSSATARYLDGSGTPQLWLVDPYTIGELAAAPTAVSVAESGDIDDASGTGGTYTAWSTSDYILWPYNAVAQKRPVLRLDIDSLNGSKSVWYHYPKSVKITGYWGFATTTNTPEIISHACEAQVLRMWGEASQKYSDVSAIRELGQIKYANALHPEVKMMLDLPDYQWLL